MSYLINAAQDKLQDGTAYQAYRCYLEGIRDDLPAHVYEFATAESHYDHTNPECLHDAWLEQLLVSEEGMGSRSESRFIRMMLQLLGAFHDRIFRLEYTGVSSYQIGNLSSQRGRGDLMIDEVGLSGNPPSLPEDRKNLADTGRRVEDLEMVYASRKDAEAQRKREMAWRN